jgi:hypothetical protein
MNLKNVPIQKLDMLPWRERFLEGKGDRKYNRGCRRCRRASLILRGSVGRDAKRTLRRIRMQTDRCPSGRRDFIRDHIHHVYYTPSGKKLFKDRYGGFHKRNYYRQINYIENGVICAEMEPRQKRPRPNARKAYYKKSPKKRENKQRREDRKREADAILSMINRPDLLQFYSSLISKYRYYNEQESKSKQPMPVRYKGDTDSYWKWKMMSWRIDTRAFTVRHRRERDAIKSQIDRLRSGQFNIYYERNAYIYNLQKECHHFGPSPHKISTV